MTEQQHNIEKISVRVNTSSFNTGNLYKDRLPEILNSQFLTDADRLFSNICSENENLILKNLAIEINLDADDDFRLLSEKLIAQLKESLLETKAVELNTGDNSVTVKGTSIKHKYNWIEGYLYFLKTGLKPWWINKEKLDDILNGNWKDILKITDDFNALTVQILRDKIIRSRFIKQQTNALSMFCFLNNKEFSSKLKARWKTWKSENNKLPGEFRKLTEEEIIHIFLKLIAEKQDISAVDKSITTSFKFIFNQWIQVKDARSYLKEKEIFQSWAEQTLFLLNVLSDGKVNKKFIKSEVISLLDQNQDQPFLSVKNQKVETYEKAEKKSNNTDIESTNDETNPTVYLPHAGLVLVYPFIKEFFKGCGLLTNSGDIISNDIAVHLLYYVATKNVNPAEHDLTLEKILCGIPIQIPIEKEVILTESQKYEAEEMLKAVSEHWTAIKKSSPDAIRSTFIMREGKLETKDFEKKLVIQRKTEDILIDKLPWSISIVKTPWMKNFLTVEW